MPPDGLGVPNVAKSGIAVFVSLGSGPDSTGTSASCAPLFLRTRLVFHIISNRPVVLSVLDARNPILQTILTKRHRLLPSKSARTWPQDFRQGKLAFLLREPLHPADTASAPARDWYHSSFKAFAEGVLCLGIQMLKRSPRSRRSRVSDSSSFSCRRCQSSFLETMKDFLFVPLVLHEDLYCSAVTSSIMTMICRSAFTSIHCRRQPRPDPFTAYFKYRLGSCRFLS